MSSAWQRWWNSREPRERKLFLLTGGVAILLVALTMGRFVGSGLTDIERRNDEMRAAITALSQSNLQTQKGPEMPKEPVDLVSYLNEIITKEVGLTAPAYPSPKKTPHPESMESSMKLALKDLTVLQLVDLLEKIESRSPVVFLRELTVAQSFRNAESNVDVDFEVYTLFAKKEGESATAPVPATTPGSVP